MAFQSIASLGQNKASSATAISEFTKKYKLDIDFETEPRPNTEIDHVSSPPRHTCSPTQNNQVPACMAMCEGWSLLCCHNPSRLVIVVQHDPT